VQLAAVRQTPYAIYKIENPTKMVVQATANILDMGNLSGTEKEKLALRLMKPKILAQAAALKTTPPKLMQK